MPWKSLRLFSILSILLLAFTACQQEKVPEPFYPRNDHEAYEKALELANLLSTALGLDWKNASNTALESPEEIELPYEEAFYADDKSANALGYYFEAKRGQKIQITLEHIAADSAKLFIDLYRIEEEGLTHIASADSLNHSIGFEPRKDAAYVLRFQTELLRGGAYKITFDNVPSLSFPVAGLTHRSIGSVWGDERDGGRRSHEGVDIFAPRGTPVIAPTDGTVKMAEEKGIGGKVIWLADAKRSQNLYFAHLNGWNVKKGDRVKTGDTLGFVGNTGNARTTPPHLHFGIYSRGAMNPIHHLKPIGRQLIPVENGFELLGSNMRVKHETKLYSDKNQKVTLGKVSKNQIVKVESLDAQFCKIRLPTGEFGFIKRSDVGQASIAIERIALKTEMPLFLKPNELTSIDMVAANEKVEVLGKNIDYLWVKTSRGKLGWINPKLAKNEL